MSLKNKYGCWKKGYIFLIVFLLLNGYGIQSLHAEETDQFTLPPKPLVDIGPTVSRRLFNVIQNAMEQTNAEIQTLLPAAKKNRKAALELARRQSDAYIVDLIYKNTGSGLPEATFERWLHWGRFPKTLQPMQFNPTWPWQTVYWLIFSHCPGALILLSPTVNLYGHYIGTDKVGHFFQQGKGYYAIYTRYLAKGKTARQAHAAMIAHGQFQEEGFFGVLLNGIYSNADLAGNYAGWKFYMNLAHRVKIGHSEHPPLIIFNGDQWKFSKHVDKDNLLKPYLNDNLNEAWNPSHYFYMRSFIRRNIKQRCERWIQRVGITREIVQAKMAETSRWHGEDYGHWLPVSDAVTLDVCFGGR